MLGFADNGIGNFTFLSFINGDNKAKKRFSQFFPSSEDIYTPFDFSRGLHFLKELFPTASKT